MSWENMNTGEQVIVTAVVIFTIGLTIWLLLSSKEKRLQLWHRENRFTKPRLTKHITHDHVEVHFKSHALSERGGRHPRRYGRAYRLDDDDRVTAILREMEQELEMLEARGETTEDAPLTKATEDAPLTKATEDAPLTKATEEVAPNKSTRAKRIGKLKHRFVSSMDAYLKSSGGTADSESTADTEEDDDEDLRKEVDVRMNLIGENNFEEMQRRHEKILPSTRFKFHGKPTTDDDRKQFLRTAIAGLKHNRLAVYKIGDRFSDVIVCKPMEESASLVPGKKTMHGRGMSGFITAMMFILLNVWYWNLIIKASHGLEMEEALPETETYMFIASIVSIIFTYIGIRGGAKYHLLEFACFNPAGNGCQGGIHYGYPLQDQVSKPSAHAVLEANRDGQRFAIVAEIIGAVLKAHNRDLEQELLQSHFRENHGFLRGRRSQREEDERNSTNLNKDHMKKKHVVLILAIAVIVTMVVTAALLGAFSPAETGGGGSSLGGP